MIGPTHHAPADARFVRSAFEPAYLGLSREQWTEKIDRAKEELRHCMACPRDCGVNRLENKTGVCLIGRHARVASAFPHFGEEDCLRGWRGSGTIFFGGCNLRCVFCQNWDISQSAAGMPFTADGVAETMLELQRVGCHNINFVTPEHVAPQVIEAVAIAVESGLRLPIVYNTSTYDSLSSLELMDGVVDIYMPDFKFWDPKIGRRMSKTADYPERAREAIAEMHRQVGPLTFGPDGLARRGVLVRHLVMPGMVEESDAIFQWLASELSPDTYVNVMEQYRPEHQVGKATRHGERRYLEINRRLHEEEFARALAAACEAGLWRFDKRGDTR